MSRAGGLVVAVALAAVFGLGAWLRTSSLDSLPVPDGDEAWFALMSARMARGESFATRTPTGNPMALLQAPVQVPLIRLFGPELWIARSASVLAGMGAILLCGWRFARVLDRTTAILAAAVLAAMPAAISASRTGWDVCLLPLFGALMLSSAFRLRVVGVLAFLGLGYLAHPTAVFALPASMAVFAARWRWPGEGQAAQPWRGLAARLALIASAGAVLAILTARRPGAQAVLETYDIGLGASHDPIRFAALFGRYFLAIGRETMPTREAASWAVVLTIAALGLARLIRRRQWDRVAMVVGASASAASLFMLSGSEILQPGMVRNGHFLLVPSTMAFACLLRAVLPEASTGPRRAARPAAFAALAAAGLALMLGIDFGALDDSKCQDAARGVSPPGESIWTFRPDVVDYRLLAIREILGDRGPARSGRVAIVCDHWNTSWAVAYHCLGRDDVAVIHFDARPGCAPAVIRTGGAVIAAPGGRAERAVRAVVSGSALSREDVEVDGRRLVSVYRRAPGIPATRPSPADFDGDGRDEVATYDPDSGRWTIVDDEGRPTIWDGPADGIPAPGDFDGDGRDEPVVYRPDTGHWLASGPDGPRPVAVRAVPGGIPAPADYDGDGHDEPAVFDPSRSAFLMHDPGLDVTFGQGADFGGDPIPAPADFDGDGRDDVAVYQADSGTWFLLRSSEGAAAVPSGLAGGRPVPGDLDGDGRAELVVHRPDSGSWQVVPIAGGAPAPLGQAADGLVAAGDFDGDGRIDLAAFNERSGEWSGPLSGGGRLAHQPEGMKR